MIASHLSIARSLSKKKKWWPSLRRKMSALKKVGGKKDVVFVHEPSLQQSLLLSSAPITWGVMEAWEGFFFFFAYTWSEWQQKLPEVLQSMNDSLTQWSCHLGCFFSCSRQSKRTEWCMMCGWQSEYMCSGGGGRWEEVTVNGGDPQTSLPLWVSLSLSVDAHMFPLCCCSPPPPPFSRYLYVCLGWLSCIVLYLSSIFSSVTGVTMATTDSLLSFLWEGLR